MIGQASEQWKRLTSALYFWVANVDEVYAKALAAGATSQSAPEESPTGTATPESWTPTASPGGSVSGEGLRAGTSGGFAGVVRAARMASKLPTLRATCVPSPNIYSARQPVSQASAGIVAPLPRICLLVQRCP